jgi:hypothetical protein
MKQVSTLFLRGAVIFIGLAVLAFCIFVLPVGIRAEDAGGYWPILLGLYVPAVPFLFALYQALKLLGLIDKNDVFSMAAVRALKRIQYCAAAISLWFTAWMPYIFHVADQDDAPGVVAIGLIIIGASFVTATFAAVLQKLFQNAVDIKSENDLTV